MKTRREFIQTVSSLIVAGGYVDADLPEVRQEFMGVQWIITIKQDLVRPGSEALRVITPVARGGKTG